MPNDGRARAKNGLPTGHRGKAVSENRRWISWRTSWRSRPRWWGSPPPRPGAVTFNFSSFPETAPSYFRGCVAVSAGAGHLEGDVVTVHLALGNRNRGGAGEQPDQRRRRRDGLQTRAASPCRSEWRHRLSNRGSQPAAWPRPRRRRLRRRPALHFIRPLAGNGVRRDGGEATASKSATEKSTFLVIVGSWRIIITKSAAGEIVQWTSMDHPNGRDSAGYRGCVASVRGRAPLPRPRPARLKSCRSATSNPACRGTAWTVFEGTEPEPIPLDIMGAGRTSPGPNQDVILAKMGGKAASTFVAGE